jgi:hypothetical protein
MSRRLTFTLAVAACAVLACASAQQRRDERLREQLARYTLPKTCEDVWPTALRIVAEKGYELVGKDRTRIGLPEQSGLGKFFSRGFETRSTGSGLVAETGADSADLRYRVEASQTGLASCRVVYTVVKVNPLDHTQREYGDPQLDLAVVREIEPERATRMAEAAEKP